MNLIERIGDAPVFYAIRILVLLVLLAVVGLALGQTEFIVACQNGICQMKESDLEKLQLIINALVEKIHELQGKSGCI
jgi:hypothetical protein